MPLCVPTDQFPQRIMGYASKGQWDGQPEWPLLLWPGGWSWRVRVCSCLRLRKNLWAGTRQWDGGQDTPVLPPVLRRFQRAPQEQRAKKRNCICPLFTAWFGLPLACRVFLQQHLFVVCPPLCVSFHLETSMLVQSHVRCSGVCVWSTSAQDTLYWSQWECYVCSRHGPFPISTLTLFPLWQW